MQRDIRRTPFFETGDVGLDCILLVVKASSDLDGEHARQHHGSGLHHFFHPVFALRQGSSRASLADRVDGASHIDVHKIHRAFLAKHFAAFCEGLRMTSRDLHAKNIFGRMATKQRPFRVLTFQYLRGNSHFPARNINPQVFAHTPVREIPNRGERGQVELSTEVHCTSRRLGQRTNLIHALGRSRRCRGGGSISGYCGGGRLHSRWICGDSNSSSSFFWSRWQKSRSGTNDPPHGLCGGGVGGGTISAAVDEMENIGGYNLGLESQQ